MKLNAILDKTRSAFTTSGVDDASLEARYLVSASVGISLAESYAYPERLINKSQADLIGVLVSRRCAREPAAYIRGVKEFYGRDFSVDARVLIPRPETELLVQVAIDHVRSNAQPARIVDVGTGCGCIAITLALELPVSTICSIDISQSALDVAWSNALKYGIGDRIYFSQGDLLVSEGQVYDVVVANLPYISDTDYPRLPPEIRMYEPPIALRGGPDGLHIIERLIAQLQFSLDLGGVALLEIGAGQEKMVSDLAKRYYPDCALASYRDLNGLVRVIKIRLSK